MLNLAWLASIASWLLLLFYCLGRAALTATRKTLQKGVRSVEPPIIRI